MTNTHAITAAHRMASVGLIRPDRDSIEYAGAIIQTAGNKRFEDLVVQVILAERRLRESGFQSLADALADELKKLGV